MKKILLFVLWVLLIGFSSAAVPSWDESSYNISYLVFEDSPYEHNFSLNLTNYNSSMVFEIGNLTFKEEEISLPNWVSLNNQTGILVINSTNDSLSGVLKFVVIAKDGDPLVGVPFNFTINATNDAPLFLDLQEIFNPYNFSFSSEEGFNIIFFAEDEEEHYPLNLTNLTILGCEKANWSTKDNCNLNYSSQNLTNTSFLLNFTELGWNDIGRYNLSVCIEDLPSNKPSYSSEDYLNKTSSCQNFSIQIQANLSIDATNCSGNFIEGGDLFCYLNLTSQSFEDNLNLNSTSFLDAEGEFFIDSFSLRNWFLSITNLNFYENFNQTIINFTNLSKRNVGNWTIQFELEDSLGNTSLENVSFFVNRTSSNSSLNLGFFREDNTSSVGAQTYFILNISDEDFLVPDKSFYNETVNLSVKIFNSTNSTQIVFWEDFSNLTFFNSGENSSVINKTLQFIPNDSQVGDWTLNFSYSDLEGFGGYELFNLTVLNIGSPLWNKEVFEWNCSVGSSPESISSCLSLNLTNSSGLLWANSTNLSNLIFSNLSAMPTNFNLTSDGLLEFSPWKQDVSQYLSEGVWDFNLSVSEGDFGLTNSSLRIVLNVTNKNSVPYFSVSPSNLDINESQPGSITFEVGDYDSLIPSYSSSLNLSISFNIVSSSLLYETGTNISLNLGTSGGKYFLSFLPKKENVGNYTINVSVRDYFGASNFSLFNLSVLGINNAPLILPITNKSYAIGDSLEFNVSANDAEDGTNLSFNYSLLGGSYFGRAISTQDIFNCEGCFNNSSGVFELLELNSSHTGVYKINASVMDNGFESLPSRSNSTIFWLFIYDSPEILSPINETVFSSSENSSVVFNFSVNHTVGDNLTYEFWKNSLSCGYQNSSDCISSEEVLIERVNLSANGTNVSWTGSLDFQDESYGNLKNLSLVVYPSTLGNSSVQTKSYFYLNISHISHPIESIGSIPSTSGYSGTGSNSGISLDMNDYFLDYDNLDDFYLENVSFEIETSSLSSEIYLGSVNSGNRLNQNSSSWLLNFYSAISVSEEVFIIARDSEGNFVQSNNFTLTFSEPPAVPSTPPSSSGGGTTITKHSSLLISVPSEVQASFGDSISVPISIENNGEVNLVGINLEGLVRLGDSSVGDVDMILSKVFIPSLAVGQKENLVAEVNINTKSAGRYLGIINAISSNPSFSQEGQFYIEIELVQSKNVEEILIFTEKLLVENPECIELRARLDDVAKLKSEGNFVDAMALSEELVESCKNSISQRKGTSLFQGDLSGVLLYLAFGLSGAFLFIIFFYVYKRVKFNKYHEDDYI